MKLKAPFYATTTLFIVFFFAECSQQIQFTMAGQIKGSLQIPARKTVVFEQTELPSAQSERRRLNTNYLATDFSATGLYIPASGTMRVIAEQQSGGRLPTLLIGTYSRYGTTKVIQPQEVKLKPGGNEISSPLGGLIWIRYTNDHPNSTARLTFINGFQKAPYYIEGITTKDQWRSMLIRMKTPDVVLQGDRCMIVVSRAFASQFQEENQDALLTKISVTIRLEDDLSGLNGSSDLNRPNVHQRYLLTQHAEKRLYFYTTDYVTAYSGDAISNILKPADVGWGVWHELGHMHQQSWTWAAATEVTVNLFSRVAQQKFTPAENWLLVNGIWNMVPQYLALPDAQRDYNTSSFAGENFVFVKLCMFEQLNLAFGRGFYPKLMEKARADMPHLTTDEEKMDYFMKSACTISGKDLRSFFQKWGLNVDSKVYQLIAAMNLPKPDRDITRLRE